MLGKFIKKVFGNSILAPLIGIAVGVLAMVLLFIVFSNGPEDSEAPGEAVEATTETTTETTDEATPAPFATGDIYLFVIEKMPAPFISPEDNRVLGFVFLDVTIEVVGEPARQVAEDRREDLKTLFATAMAEKGAGMDSRPGVVDYDRLSNLFSEIVEAEVGPGGIARVIVLPAIEG